MLYGGVLAPPKENWDGLKAGMFEAAAFCAAYTPGKVPLHTVQELPFMAPDGTGNIGKMWIALWDHPALKKELLKYATDKISLGTMGCAYVANKDAWGALPDEFKKYHKEWYMSAPDVWNEEYMAADKKWIPIFKKNLEITDFPAAERAKLVAKAQEVYDVWVKAREKQGLPGREILEYYIKKRKEITGK